MIIKLVSFPVWNHLSPSQRQHRIEVVAEILNQKKTQRNAKNRAEFRLANNVLKKRFDKVLSSVDVVLNLVHTRWSRFYDLSCRFYKFSENRRYCFYCAQLKDHQLANALKNPTNNTAQRAMRSRRLLAPYYTEKDHQDYLLQAYEI